MISREVMQECVKISHTHASVAKLLEAYNVLSSSPYVESYMVVYDLIESWQTELKENGHKIKLLNAEDKAFDRAFKLSTNMQELIAGLDAIRDKMSPEQKEDADKKRKAKKSEGKIII